MIKSYDSIIFDLDGTLWDPTEVCLNSWNEVITKSDFVQEPITAEALQQIFGLKFDLIADILFPTLTDKQKQKVMQDCIDHENMYIRDQGGKLYEPLEEILRTLTRTHRLFIVSNCQAGYIESFLAYYQLESYFVDFECPGNTGLDKAENIKLIIQRNNLQAPIYVGDTEGDFKASKANHLPFFFVDYGFGKVDGADVILTQLRDLLID